MSWLNSWEYNQLLVMLRQDKSTKELKRKADKAIRLKGKIWTVEELDYFEAIGKSWAEFFRQEDEKEIK